MTIYTIRGTREVLYEFCVTADHERGALEEIAIIGQGGYMEKFAYAWEELKITEIEAEEE
jgi:hypothetical protein